MSPKAKTVSDKLLAKGAKVALVGAPADQRGLYMGTYGLVWSVASICGPSIGLWLFSVNHTLLWLMTGVFGFTASAIIFAGRHEDLSARPLAAPVVS